VAFVFHSTLQSKAKKGGKNPHSEAVKKGAKKNTSGFATPFNFLLLFLVFRVHFVGF
jgi:hypothetical protein